MDVLVIGSGIGGLSTGLLLANSGFKVTVLEKNRLPGGMIRGFIRQGLECPVGVHYLGALGSGQILRRFLISWAFHRKLRWKGWDAQASSTDIFLMI